MSEEQMSSREEGEELPRHRIRRYKSEEVMQQECHDFVMAGKRLPKLHSRWLYNRYINAGHSIQACVQANTWLNAELEKAKATIRELREQL